MKIEALQVGPIGTNCYLLSDETRSVCAVVDPGGEGGRIARAVDAAGWKPVCILLTHGHTDHTDGLGELLAHFTDLPVYLNPADPVGTSRLFGPLPAGIDLRPYGEGDTVAVGDLTVRVLATPGHSKGSVTLWAKDALLCGDTLFAGSCGRTDLPGGDLGEILGSLKRLGNLPGNLQVLPGHMESSTLDAERTGNPYLSHALRM